MSRISYEEALAWLARYAKMQKECGFPPTMQDLREYRQWKNMPQDSNYDAELLREMSLREGRDGHVFQW